ncbi:unnamed protein product [Phytophthora fragariaefolia]|uniref:Unnamed protein product n=1 Tax=Phytophthora fragariaefolia TaxID=1490495 RepID=A0A9W6YMM2_9STRA|nr:unnamed protein product [Phytophthora fragariaefolia]
MTSSPAASISEPSTSVLATPAASQCSDNAASPDSEVSAPSVPAFDSVAPRAKRTRRPAKKRESKPTKPKIRTKDPFERQAELLKMKNDRLQAGHNFMCQRQLYMSSTEFSDRKKYEATNGDFVSTRFEIVPLPGARSVKAVIDALQFFVYNIEISLSEVVGDITVRENDDAKPGSPVAQHRLVATVADMVQTDTNNVAFAEYRPAGPPGSCEHEYGLMICDAVDEDELFPYRPQTRIRQDMTQITMVTMDQTKTGEPMIVMTRRWCLRIRKSDIYMPPFVVERIRSGVEKVGEAMLATARRATNSTSI